MALHALGVGWEKSYEKEANPERNSKWEQINVHVHNHSTGLGRRTLVFRPPRMCGGQVTVESCGRGTYSEGSPQSNRLWSPGPRGLRQEIAAGIWFLAQRINQDAFCWAAHCLHIPPTSRRITCTANSFCAAISRFRRWKVGLSNSSIFPQWKHARCRWSFCVLTS
jgi:hypothetical protein